MTPTTEYEKYGDVNNVVFPTGLCNIEGELFIYYGGADKFCCLATVELNDLLEYIFQNSWPCIRDVFDKSIEGRPIVTLKKATKD